MLKYLLLIVNIAVIAGLFWKVHSLNTDTAPNWFIYSYPILVLLNAVVWLLAARFRSSSAEAFKVITIIMLLLYIPLIGVVYFL